mgnify:CR=1 FL=1
MPRRRRIPCRMNLFSSSMAACLVSPVRWIYSFLVMQTFSCRNSISLSFLVSSVVSVFFDFLVGECVLSSFILCLIFLRNVLLIRKCTFWKRTDSDLIFFFSSSVSWVHFNEVLKNPNSPSSTMLPLASPYNVFGQMLKHSNVFYKLFLGISFFRTYTGMERFFFLASVRRGSFVKVIVCTHE